MKKEIGLTCLVFLIFLLSPISISGIERVHVAVSNDRNFVFMKNDGTGKFPEKDVYKTKLTLPHEITAGDFDADGIWDVAVSHWQNGLFGIYWGARQENGEIKFGDGVGDDLLDAEQLFDLSKVPREGGCIAAECPGQFHAIGKGDFDEDGDTDLVIIDNENSAVRSAIIAFNLGKREFGNFKRYEMPDNKNTRRVKVDDFNNDKYLDFIIPNAESGTYNLFLGDGKGSFEGKSREAGIFLHEIESGDINSDGLKDLFFADRNVIVLLLNTGAGEFVFSQALCVKDSNQLCIAGDFFAVEPIDLDNDGDLDIAAIKEDGLYLWNYNGEFKIVQYSKFNSDKALDMETADFNQDGKNDIAVGTFINLGADGQSGVRVFLGAGNGKMNVLGTFEAERISGFGGNDQVMIDIFKADVEEVQGPVFLRGDADNNGKLDMTDAIFILRHLYQGGEAPLCEDAADADDTGVIALTDAVRILSFLFRGGPPPLFPFPEKGVDQSEDELGCKE